MENTSVIMLRETTPENEYYSNPELQRVLENSLKLVSSINARACGKCAPCRIGHIQMQEILVRMINRNGRKDDLETLITLARTLNETSFCPAGRKAPSQLLNAIDHITMIE